MKPDVHIFTKSKLQWFELACDSRAFNTFYKIKELWTSESPEQMKQAVAELAARSTDGQSSAAR